MQKTLDGLISDMRAELGLVDSNTEVMGDLAKGLLVQNMVSSVLNDVVARNQQLAQELRAALARPVSFQDRAAKLEASPYGVDEHMPMPRVVGSKAA